MRSPDGCLNVGTMEGKALEVVEMMKRRKMKVMRVRETKWKGDRALQMAEGYTMIHAGGDGRGNGVGIILNVEISKEVARVERWQERIFAVWTMIRRHMVCVICVYGPQTGRTEAEKEAFREEVARLAGLGDGQTMLCVAGDFSAHIGVFEPGDDESNEHLDGEQGTGRTRTRGHVEEKRVGGSGHVLPEEGEPRNHLQERTAQHRPQ